MRKTVKITLGILLIAVLVAAGAVLLLAVRMSEGSAKTVEAPPGYFDPATSSIAPEAPGEAAIVSMDAAGAAVTPMPIYQTERMDAGIVNILLVGTDVENAPGDRADGRSDTMIIASYNMEENQLLLISLMRDAQVIRIGENGRFRAKLNAAFSSGGVGELINTINANFGLDIQEYAAVGFDGLCAITDAVTKGQGLPLHTTAAEAYYINWRSAGLSKAEDKSRYRELLESQGKPLLNDEGDCEQPLNGEQALWYCRDRASEFIQANGEALHDDRARIARQQYFLTRLYEAVRADPDWQSVVALYDYAIRYVSTNMEPDLMIDLLSALYRNNPAITFYRIPESYTNARDEAGNETSELLFDIDAAKEQLHTLIYGSGEASPAPAPSDAPQ